jgi:hypothetical protein
MEELRELINQRPIRHQLLTSTEHQAKIDWLEIKLQLI